MILFFADGLRETFGGYAETVFNQAYKQKEKTNVAEFNLFKFFGLDNLFEAVVGIYFGIEATNPQAQYLKSFLTRAIRRYVMIKLQDGGWTMEHVLQAFGIPSIQTSCLAPFKPSAAVMRRKSFNATAGVTTAESLMALAGKSIKLEEGVLTTEGADLAQIQSIAETVLSGITSPEPTVKSRVTLTMTYDATKFDHLIGIIIASYSKQGGHANTIIRYRNQFYYCDNNIGEAVILHPQLSSDLELKGDSIKFQYATEDDASFHFYVNGKEYARGPSMTGISPDVYSSRQLLYFYANEPVALPPITTPITSPPPLKPVVVTEPITSNKFTATSSAYSAFWHRRAADAKVASARVFSKTRRVERIASATAATAKSVTRFSRTLRADRGKN